MKHTLTAKSSNLAINASIVYSTGYQEHKQPLILITAKAKRFSFADNDDAFKAFCRTFSQHLTECGLNDRQLESTYLLGCRENNKYGYLLALTGRQVPYLSKAQLEYWLLTLLQTCSSNVGVKPLVQSKKTRLGCKLVQILLNDVEQKIKANAKLEAWQGSYSC